jgi:hypothetical protein
MRPMFSRVSGDSLFGFAPLRAQPIIADNVSFVECDIHPHPSVLVVVGGIVSEIGAEFFTGGDIFIPT